MEIIDGSALAKQILDDLKKNIAILPFQPVFCDILVGNDPASRQYVGMKAKTAERVGFKFRRADFPEDISDDSLVSEIKNICAEPGMRGLIVQLPLPESFDKQKILDSIDPKIDVDCIGSVNSEKFYSGRPYVVFPTAAAVMRLLEEKVKNLVGKKTVVVGYGDLVGKPVKFLLERHGAKVDLIRSQTPNPEIILKEADIIVSATGRPGLITAQKVKPGAVVIDAGTAESAGGIVGDVDRQSLSGVAGWLSPVPGGVGPVTVAMLMKNVFEVSKMGAV